MADDVSGGGAPPASVADRLAAMRDRVESAERVVGSAEHQRPVTAAALSLLRAFGPGLTALDALDDPDLTPEGIRASSLSPDVESQADELARLREQVATVRRHAGAVVDEATREAIRRLPAELAGLRVRDVLGDAGATIAAALHGDPDDRIARVRGAARGVLSRVDLDEATLAGHVEDWLALVASVEAERREAAGAWSAFAVHDAPEPDTGSGSLDLLLLVGPRARIDDDRLLVGLPRALGVELGLAPSGRARAGSVRQAAKLVGELAAELRAAVERTQRAEGDAP